MSKYPAIVDAVCATQFAAYLAAIDSTVGYAIDSAYRSPFLTAICCPVVETLCSTECIAINSAHLDAYSSAFESPVYDTNKPAFRWS